MYFFFFFQAEDGIRDKLVTGVQTCALPISPRGPRCSAECAWSSAAAATARPRSARPSRPRARVRTPPPAAPSRAAWTSRSGALGRHPHRCNAGGVREHPRSEEHTSELQSLAYLVCRLL